MIVSVVVPVHNAAPYLEACIASLQRQSLEDLEIIVIDDGSTDAGPAILQRLTAADGRIRMFRHASARGPAAARNTALAHASGDWIAFVDADDFIHPLRFEAMVGAAERLGSDIIADNLLIFDDDATRNARWLFKLKAPLKIELGQYVRDNQLLKSSGVLGYLKPMLRRARIEALSHRFVESLRIAEDYDFVARLLAHGLTFHVIPDAYYFYRKHPSSISHRLSTSAIEAMLVADTTFRAVYAAAVTPAIACELDARRRSIELAVSYQRFVDEAKRGGRRALGGLLRQPQLWPLVGRALGESIQRRLVQRRRAGAPAAERRATLISRQRVEGATNGSSVYLLNLVKALKNEGWRVDLIAPTPQSLGRWPYMARRPEAMIFDRVRFRGCWVAGRYVVRQDPVTVLRAAYAVLDRLSRRLQLPDGWFRSTKSPYTIAAPWDSDDLLFIANETRPSQLLIADYAFQTYALPFALLPGATKAVVMHDVFSLRATSFAAASQDSVASVSERDEVAALAQADALVAIQSEEAEWARRVLPRCQVLVAPTPALLAPAPQPGDEPTILFVGSNTAPNVLALQWWFDAIWPTVRTVAPNCKVLIAGSIVNAHLPRLDGVQFLGLVPDLAPLYRSASVVISPLTAGSGLKVKFVEALGMGKAIVATPKTLEGVPPDVQSAVKTASEAQDFARCVIAFLNDEPERRLYAGRALEAARRYYSTDACFAELRSLLASIDGRHFDSV